jgi:hypothetical protein
MGCTITSLFLIAMFGIIAAGVAFRPDTKESRRTPADMTPRSAAMVGSAVLAMAVSSVASATAIITPTMARPRCAGGAP